MIMATWWGTFIFVFISAFPKELFKKLRGLMPPYKKTAYAK
tara:strand:- start:282 stop:404 length:123 start_codon:yes stop_codon:yes gene_type:complete